MNRSTGRLMAVFMSGCIMLSSTICVYADDGENAPLVGLDAMIQNDSAEAQSRSLDEESVNISYSGDDHKNSYGTRAEAVSNSEGSTTSTIEVKEDVTAVSEGKNSVWAINSSTETGADGTGPSVDIEAIADVLRFYLQSGVNTLVFTTSAGTFNIQLQELLQLAGDAKTIRFVTEGSTMNIYADGSEKPIKSLTI